VLQGGNTNNEAVSHEVGPLSFPTCLALMLTGAPSFKLNNRPTEDHADQ